MVNGRCRSCVMRLKKKKTTEYKPFSWTISNDLTMAFGKCEDLSPRDTWNKSSVGVEPSHGAEGWSHSLANGEQMRRPKIRGRDQGSNIFTCKAFWQTSPSIKEKTGWEKTSGATVGRVLPNARSLNLKKNVQEIFPLKIREKENTLGQKIR